MTALNIIELVECPRDAMQGWDRNIGTGEKIAYLNQLLRVGFHTLDFGSFVSPKAIPQMADTKDVVKALDLSQTSTKLLAIVANERGAEDAMQFDAISFLGFPFSVSETFQQKNTNSSIAQSLERVKHIGEICKAGQKELVVYLSMAFGNPYGDEYSPQLVANWAAEIADLGVKIISLADTVGLASPQNVFQLSHTVIKALPHCKVGVHLHSSPHNWNDKLQAAINAGCKRFDGAINGIGGCPMSGSELVGNMNTTLMVPYLKKLGWLTTINKNELQRSVQMADKIFI